MRAVGVGVRVRVRVGIKISVRGMVSVRVIRAGASVDISVRWGGHLRVGSEDESEAGRQPLCPMQDGPCSGGSGLGAHVSAGREAVVDEPQVSRGRDHQDGDLVTQGLTYALSVEAGQVAR